MKFLPYLFKNVFRNKLRTCFTILSIAVSLSLVTLLYGFIMFQEEMGSQAAQYNRILVTSSQGLTQPLPVAHLDQIRKLSGAKVVAPMSWFGGIYGDDKVAFAQFGTDPAAIFGVYDELSIPPDQQEVWEDDRTGCVIGSELAEMRGWKVGDQIRLKGAIYGVDLDMVIRGIFTSDVKSGNLQSMFFHWNYMEELLKQARNPAAGLVGVVAVKAESAKVLPDLMEEINARFASNRVPVRAMTEQAFQNMFIEMAGNVQAFIRNVALAVVFSLICVAGNAMAMSLRERTREVAVLRAIGFQRGTILVLVLGEAVAIAVLGGLLGSLGTKGLIDALNPGRYVDQLAFFYIPWNTAILAFLLAGAIGLVSGIFPAWRASRISVVDGLRKII